MTLRKESRGWFVASIPPLTTHQREYTALHKIVRSPVRPSLHSYLVCICRVHVNVQRCMRALPV